MAELRTLVEHEMERGGSPSYSFDDLARRRDRKQLNRRIAAGAVALALVALVIGAWIGLVTLGRSTPADRTPAPDGSVRFESPLYGYSIEIPSDWRTSAANIEWRWGESLSEGFMPPYGRDDSFYGDERGISITVMAIPLDMTEEQWLDHVEGLIAGDCREPPVVEPLTLDGAPGRLVSCGYVDTLFVAAAGRGYEIWGYDDEVRPILETMRLTTDPPAHRPSSADAWRGIWPQTTREEAEAAQAAANAGDRAFTWQTSWWEGSHESERVETRFLQEGLVWEEFRGLGGGGTGRLYGPYTHSESIFVRCEPGGTNPAYPGLGCAPSEGNRFPAVLIRTEQLIEPGHDGIWIVTRAEELPPFEQTVPPSEEEIRELIASFAEARIAGRGAEAHLLEPGGEVPLLYATSTGAPYEDFEISDVDGPVWPHAETGLTLRMFASGGDVVVEQRLAVLVRSNENPTLPDGLWLEGMGRATEDGRPVPATMGILGGRVTLAAILPWYGPWGEGISEGTESILSKRDEGGLGGEPAYFVVLADPWLPQPGCGRIPVSAGDLVRGIIEHPGLRTTDPVTTSVGGIGALRIDVSGSAAGERCEGWPERGVPVVFTDSDDHPFTVRDDAQMRIYILELPGEPAETLAIMIITTTDAFDRVVEAAAPIMDSFVFEAGTA